MRRGKRKTRLGLGELNGVAGGIPVYFCDAQTHHDAVASPEHAVILPSLMLNSN